MKTLVISSCRHCRFFDEGWGARCFHPKVAKPLKDGVRPKALKETSELAIPDWCPLPDAQQPAQEAQGAF